VTEKGSRFPVGRVTACAAALCAATLSWAATAGAQRAPARSSSPSEWPSALGLGADQFELIPPGTFQMGATNVGPAGLPIHQVTITKPFHIQKTEVTQAQWRAVMGTNPSRFSECGPTCPVEQVSWDDIQQFLERLNASSGGGRFRLPTEAEWEYAARAGTTGDYGSAGVLDDLGWYHGNAGGRTHPVGEKAPNVWGLHDMHGNVWEWVADWYSASYYAASPTSDPTGPPVGAGRVLRGGSWLYFANFARSAYRIIFVPSYRLSDFGFRLARTP
jgi:formylglycine-generating enzyme required for sulfatase activity